jgi:hypothetical protein
MKYIFISNFQTLIFGQHNFNLINENNIGALFSINSATGELRTQSSLYSDDDLTYPIRVTVSDRGPSACTSTTVVTVNVNRNLVGPVWTNTKIGKFTYCLHLFL